MDSSEPSASPAVLLVDDEELYLRALVDDYRRRGYVVTARRDLVGGEQAYRELRRQGQVPVLVVDLIQPGEDGGYLGGLDLLRRLRPGPETDVIVLADSEAEWLATAARSLGARRTVTKPDLRRVEPEHLDQAVRSFLDDVAGRARNVSPCPPPPALRPGPGPDEPLLGALEELRHMRDRASILLLVMRFAADMAARGVLYEVEGDHLRALGRFGLSGGNGAGKMVPLDRDTLPGRAFWSGRLQRCCGPELSALMPELPEPRPRDAMALPVLGSDRVIAVIYGDSGGAPEGLPDLRALSALAATASLALDGQQHPADALRGV